MNNRNIEEEAEDEFDNTHSSLIETQNISQIIADREYLLSIDEDDYQVLFGFYRVEEDEEFEFDYHY